MKTKSWLKYFIYFLLIFSTLFFRETKTVSIFSKQVLQDFSVNYANVIISTLLGVCIGLILGLDHFINEIKKEGCWKIRIPKLIMIGLPSLYLSLTNIFLFSSSQFLKNISINPFHYLTKNFTVGYVDFSQLIFGYILITSFYKYSKEI